MNKFEIESITPDLKNGYFILKGQIKIEKAELIEVIKSAELTPEFSMKKEV